MINGAGKQAIKNKASAVTNSLQKGEKQGFEEPLAIVSSPADRRDTACFGAFRQKMSIQARESDLVETER